MHVLSAQPRRKQPALHIVGRNGNVWLAKLNRQSDRFNVVRVECAMLDLAAACGISVPEHAVEHVHGQDVLLVRRFDRAVSPDGILRHRMVSAATVFQADEAAADTPTWDRTRASRASYRAGPSRAIKIAATYFAALPLTHWHP